MIVVDTSALVAIFLREPDFEAIIDTIDVSPSAVVSVCSRFEAISVLCGRRVRAEPTRVADFLDGLHLDLAPVGIEQMRQAIDALLTFGKGRHPAKLNFGDCFSYGLAKENEAALLFTGNDFALTDIRPAWRPASPTR